jgi:hypothetical protein
VVRKQLAMAEAQLDTLVHLPRAERLTLAVITARLKTCRDHFLEPHRVENVQSPRINGIIHAYDRISTHQT